MEYLWIIPAISAEDFDYSPLYKMPNIKWLHCQTIYGEKEDKVAFVDYSQMQGIQSLFIGDTKGHENIIDVKGLKSLCLEHVKPKSRTIENEFDGTSIENLIISQSTIRSLRGLENAKKIKRLELVYNRNLEDISTLEAVKDTLCWLDIDKCGKIRDFSVLSELRHLELLRLSGTNILPNLSFLNEMENLKFLVITMNVEDGKLDMCKQIPYVAIKNRKHYNCKDKDFSKISSSIMDISKYMNG